MFTGGITVNSEDGKDEFQSLFKYIYTGTFSQFVGQQFVPQRWPNNCIFLLDVIDIMPQNRR